MGRHTASMLPPGDAEGAMMTLNMDGHAVLKVRERLKVQPLDQLLAIGRLENVLEIVFAAGFAGTAGDGH